MDFPSQNASKNPPKSFKNQCQDAFHLGSLIFVLDVGHFFAQNGVTELSSSFFFVGSMLFFDFFAVLAQSWRHLGSIWEGLGLDFGSFWFPFFFIFGNMFEPFLHTPSVVFRPSWKTHSSSWKTHGKPTAPLGKLIFDVCWAWFWMGWWGHAER